MQMKKNQLKSDYLNNEGGVVPFIHWLRFSLV